MTAAFVMTSCGSIDEETSAAQADAPSASSEETLSDAESESSSETDAESLSENVTESSLSAEDDSTAGQTGEYPEMVSFIIEEDGMGEVQRSVPLYDLDGNLTAHCLEFEDAYLIYDENGEIPEYSPSNKSPYEGIETKCYYLPPLTYIAEKDGVLIDLHTNSEFTAFNEDTSDNSAE